MNENLLKIERMAKIRALVDEYGRVTVPDLSERFEVSQATIRRDLEEMNEKGWLVRTHGGALRTERALKEPPVLQRMYAQQEEKGRIAGGAAQLIHSGETIFLGSGTTVLEIAKRIGDDIDLTVITNSHLIVSELASKANIDLIVIGGMFRQSELSMVGHIAEQAVREFRADYVFMGMRAIDIQHGFTNDYLPETMTDRAILSIGAQIVIVADHTKFGKVSSVFVAPISAADLIITDRRTSKELIAEFAEVGINISQF